MTDAPAAPSTGLPTEVADMTDANAVFGAKPLPNSPEQREEKVETTEQANETTKTDDRPDAMKDAEKKSRLDKLGKVAKPEVKKDEVKPNGTDKTIPEATEFKTNKDLRDAYEKMKKEYAAIQAEYGKFRPEYEQKTQEHVSMRDELAKLKAMNLSDAERSQLSKLNEIHALDVLRESDEYKQKLLAPIQSAHQRIANAAKEAKLTPIALQALQSAMDVPDELQRNREIRRIFKESGAEGDDLMDFVSAMTRVGSDLNEKLYPALEAKEKQALEIAQAAKTREKEQTQEMSAKEAAELKKEQDRVREILRDDKLKVLFEDTDLSIDGTTLEQAMSEAAAADNPADRAYEIHAAAALPFVLAWANKQAQRAHELEQANKIRNGAGPKRTDSVQKGVDTGERKMTAEEAFKSGQSFGM